MMPRNPKIYLVGWKLLSEWWHADADCTEDEIAQEIYSQMMTGIASAGTPMMVTLEQVKQRLFGGFGCIEGGFHVFHATGHYTYMGQNYDLSPDARRQTWQELMEGNPDDPFTEGTPFTSDYPGWREECAKTKKNLQE